MASRRSRLRMWRRAAAVGSGIGEGSAAAAGHWRFPDGADGSCRTARTRAGRAAGAAGSRSASPLINRPPSWPRIWRRWRTSLRRARWRQSRVAGSGYVRYPSWALNDLGRCRINGATGGAGGARTHDRRIMRSMLPRSARASCADGTEHRTDGTRRAGIIWRPGPRTGPRPRPLRPMVLLLCVTSPRAIDPRPRAARPVMGQTAAPRSSPAARRYAAAPRPLRTASDHRSASRSFGQKAV